MQDRTGGASAVRALIVALLLVGLLSTANAGINDSLYTWWRSNVDATDTAADIWGYLDNSMQYWTTPASLYTKGYSYLHLEIAGHAEWNYFGWYTPIQSETGTFTRNQIFDGDTQVPAFTAPLISLTPSQNFGFYLDYERFAKNLTPTSTDYVPDASFFTEDNRNGTDSPKTSLDRTDWDSSTSPWGSSVNADGRDPWGTYGYRHARVFKDPRYDPGYAWIIAWEDLAANNSLTDKDEYKSAWTDPETLKWGEGSTSDGPDWDYNDMVVSFRFATKEGFTPPTPELSTWLLLGISLAAVPVLRHRRRS